MMANASMPWDDVGWCETFGALQRPKEPVGKPDPSCLYNQLRNRCTVHEDLRP